MQAYSKQNKTPAQMDEDKQMPYVTEIVCQFVQQLFEMKNYKSLFQHSLYRKA